MSNAHIQADRLAELLSQEHGAMAEFLVALAEFDRQRGWEELGYASLFWFLHRRLKLSKGAALYRKTAAELIQGHPGVLPPLRDGRLCLSTVFEVAKVLTTENAAAVLPKFFHLSRKEAAEVAAAIRPVEKVPSRDVVTRVPTHHDSGVTVHPVDRNPRDERLTTGEMLLQPCTPPSPPSVVPLDADSRRLHVTVSKRLLAKLDAARDALSHSHPMGSTEAILEVGLDLILARHRRGRGIGATPRRGSRPAGPGRISAAVKREVWDRDGGRCQWPVQGGGICGATLRLEFDHRVPKGLGGASDAANVRLLCRFHNQRAAREVYGDEAMDRFAPRLPQASEPVAVWRSRATSPDLAA